MSSLANNPKYRIEPFKLKIKILNQAGTLSKKQSAHSREQK
jgi:hypothetical protein